MDCFKRHLPSDFAPPLLALKGFDENTLITRTVTFVKSRLAMALFVYDAHGQVCVWITHNNSTWLEPSYSNKN